MAPTVDQMWPVAPQSFPPGVDEDDDDDDDDVFSLPAKLIIVILYVVKIHVYVANQDLPISIRISIRCHGSFARS